MKLHTVVFLSFLSFLVSVAGASASDLVSDVSARQRWPWSGKVDVTYTYTGETPTSVCFTATWKGQPTPIDIVALEATGTFLVTNGTHRFEWDPVAAGYGSQALVDFQVQAAVTNADPRTYLVVDLVNGGYELLSSVPDGGWTTEHKQTKMVFRRIPAGTYELGFPKEDFFQLEAENGWSRGVGLGMTPRTVTLSSDYYYQIFLTTVAQKQYLQGYVNGSFVPLRGHDQGGYWQFRGKTLDDGETVVDWPHTGYRVASDSYVGELRAKLGGGLLLDLPTQEQWEIAMRAGTKTIWPNGGDANSTTEELNAFINQISWCRWVDGVNATPYSHDVGLKACNAWGIYDFNVVDAGEATLSYANDAAEPDATTKKLRVDYPTGGLDPIGPTSSLHKARIFMGGFSYLSSGPVMRELPTPKRAGVEVSEGQSIYCGARFAIYLKPLVRE